jgi:hypothetical protein
MTSKDLHSRVILALNEIRRFEKEMKQKAPDSFYLELMVASASFEAFREYPPISTYPKLLNRPMLNLGPFNVGKKTKEDDLC